MATPQRWVVGQTHPVISFTCLDDTNTAVDLTGAVSFAIQFEYQSNPEIAPYAGTGVFSIVSATGGLLNYAQASSDFPTEGNLDFRVSVTFSDGSLLYFDIVSIIIDPKN